MTRRQLLQAAAGGIGAAALARALPSNYNFNVVCVGDSLTQGFLASDSAHVYPIVMKTSGYLKYPGTQANPTNLGVGGRMLIGDVATACTGPNTPANCTLTMTSQGAPDVDPLIVGGGRRNVLVVWGGTNDAARGGGDPTQARMLTGLDNYVATRLSNGWNNVIVPTMISRNWSSFGATCEAIRVAYNSHILGMSNATVVDLAANSAFAAGFGAGSPAYNNTTYYNADGVHLTDVGYALVAQIIATAINGLLRLFPGPIFSDGH